MRLNKFTSHISLLPCVFLFWISAAAEVEKDVNTLPIFDGHIHYSHDVWDAITPSDAIKRLREAGVKRALVSSSSDEGHLMKAWHILLTRHADRFLLGIDTYEPQRWLQIKNVMSWQRELLGALPYEVARKIDYENSEQITKLFDASNNLSAD